MLALLTSLGLAMGVQQKFARAAGIGVAAAVAIALLLGLRALIISNHDTKQELKAERVDRKADNGAAEQRRADDAREAHERRQLEESVNHGQTDADRRLAFYRCLRLQQQARERRQPSPACSGSGVPGGTAGAH